MPTKPNIYEIHDRNEYIKKSPAEARILLKALRKIIRSSAPKAEEKISYGMPMYMYHGMLVAFGSFRNHVGLYLLMSDFLPKYKKELSRYKTATGTIQFPFGRPIPEALVKKLVRARVKINEKKAKAKIKTNKSKGLK